MTDRTARHKNSPAPNSDKTLRAVMFGDVHLYSQWAWPHELLGKRLLGMANLWVTRRNRLKMELFEAVVQRMADCQPDLVLGSGDLTMTSLASEFDLARRMIQPLIDRFDTLIIPGNHDRYTYTAARRKRFEQYFAPQCPDAYPYHRKLADRLHLVALNGARPTPINARGRLRRPQRDALGRIINEQLTAEDRLIVLCHYGIGTPRDVQPENPFHGLADLRQLTGLLRQVPCPTLYVHGHIHKSWCWRHSALEHVLTVNTGAPVLTSEAWPGGQGFWELQVQIDSDTPWQLARHFTNEQGHWQTQPVDPATLDPGQRADVRPDSAR